MNGPDASIHGSALRLQREARGLTLAEIAVRSCLSLKQVRQLEEGGCESFYSEAVKLTAAKKVASLLGLPPSGLQTETEANQPQDPLVIVVESVETPLAMAANSDALPSPTQDSKHVRASLWVMATLFAAALLFAAWMNPRAELPTSDAEAPPLQTLPSETSNFASSAASVASEAVNTASD